MSTASVSGVREQSDEKRHDGIRQAFWLASKDMKRAWLSYPASGLFLLVFGFFALSLLWNLDTKQVNGNDGVAEATFFVDFFFVIMSCLMVVNALSMDYARIWTTDVFSERTVYLKSLPISTGTLVRARVISMSFAIPFTVPAFFLPIYFFTDLGELGFSYIWFVGIWLGWAVLYGGVTLLCELGLSGRIYCWMSFVIVFVVIASILMVEALGGISLVGGSVALADRFGPIPAIISLVIGVVGFWLLARLTVKRVDAREVGS